MTIRTPAHAEHADDLQCDAYNAAFYELGLGWHWDAGTWRSLAPLTSEVERISTYMQAHHAHLLHAYEPAFLAGAITSARTRCVELMQASGGALAGKADWAALQSRQIGA
jgi:hypothetical protein